MYQIAITKVATGETRYVDFSFEYLDYMWEEGNYSCDCNREMFFERAGGKEVDATCSEGRYEAKLVKGKK